MAATDIIAAALVRRLLAIAGPPVQIGIGRHHAVVGLLRGDDHGIVVALGDDHEVVPDGRRAADGARARAFLEGKGYRMASDDILSQRLVYLVDEAKRNELMIIYLEDLSGMGLTAADLAEGGRAAAKWDEISNGLLDRAVKGMRVLR